MFMITLEQIALHIPLIIGAYLVLSLLKLPDLSIESAYLFGALFGVTIIARGQHLPPAVLLCCAITASLIGGALVGFTSSMLSQKGKIPHLLSAILTMGLVNGCCYLMAATYISLAGLKNPLALLPGVSQFPEFIIISIIAVLVIVMLLFFVRTQLGNALAVYGNNPHFFKHYGIQTSYVVIIGTIIGNALAGCSGYLFAQSNGFFQISFAQGKILLCLTALILGKNIIRSQRPISVFMPLVGCAAYFILQQALLRAGFNLNYFTAVQALIVLLVLLISIRMQNGKRSIDNLGV